jgi:hypothetical protein
MLLCPTRSVLLRLLKGVRERATRQSHFTAPILLPPSRSVNIVKFARVLSVLGQEHDNELRLSFYFFPQESGIRIVVGRARNQTESHSRFVIARRHWFDSRLQKGHLHSLLGGTGLRANRGLALRVKTPAGLRWFHQSRALEVANQWSNCFGQLF